MAAIFYGVGIGPGDPELLTVKAIRTIERCSVIAAPQTSGTANLALDVVQQAVDLEHKEVLLLPFAMSRDSEILRKAHEAAAQQVVEVLKQGRDVALLNLGDVSIYATFNYLKPLVEQAGFRTVMIPGIPSFCAVAAALGENLTPDMNTPLSIVPAACDDLGGVLGRPGVKVVMKAGRSLGNLKSLLAREGLYEQTSLVQNCCLPNERVAKSLDDALEDASYFTTMIVRA